MKYSKKKNWYFSFLDLCVNNLDFKTEISWKDKKWVDIAVCGDCFGPLVAELIDLTLCHVKDEWKGLNRLC